jgi:hypothetical protein
MATRNGRIERLESETQFRRWPWPARLLESPTIEQLEKYACHGRLRDPLPEPLPRESEQEGLDRKHLMQLREEDQRFFGGRSEQELIYFCFHAHWPEQACNEPGMS